MRTTVTIDPDLAAKLRALARERRLSFNEVLIGALRRGLSEPGGAPRPYRLRTRQMYLRHGIDLDKALRLSGGLEDAETIRKLE